MNPTSFWLLLSLCLLGSPSAWAGLGSPPLADAPLRPRYSLLQDGSATAPLPGTQAAESRGEEARPGLGLRVLAEVGLGLGGTIVGGAVVGGLGWALASNNRDFGTSLLVLSLAGAGAALGMPVGVWLGGKLLRGEGTFLGSLLGAGAGWAGTLILIATGVLQGTALVLPFMLALPLTFAVVGYEVADALVQSSRPSRGAGVSVRPLLAPVAGGALVGLGGRF